MSDYKDYYGNEKICAKCGDTYYGTAQSKYCVVCKVDAMNEQQKANARRRYARLHQREAQ